jgi:hypothetical protein
MPLFYRFSYQAKREKSRLLPHQVRDGAAFLELSSGLYSKGYEYGGLLLNYPSDDNPNEDNQDDDCVRLVPVDTSFLKANDLLVLTTRPPMDDKAQGDHKKLRRSCTSLEDQLFRTTLRRYFEVCARSHVKLSPRIAEQLGEFSSRADIAFFQKADALSSYKSCSRYGSLRPEKYFSQQTTAAYFLYTHKTWPGGPGLMAAFGMGGTETLVWSHMLRTRKELAGLLYSPVFAIAELRTVAIPSKPANLDFSKEWAINLILKYDLT